MNSRELPGYCSFTKAIEHLGDRWSLLIVRQLRVYGPLGFNELIRSMPGRISRSVLTERLRRLETLCLVSREGSTGYRLTTVGAGLMPVLLSLRGWAETWLPDDPAARPDSGDWRPLLLGGRPPIERATLTAGWSARRR